MMNVSCRKKNFSTLSFFLLFISICSAQSSNLQGLVTNEKNEPVPFSVIVIKGIGVYADDNGHFTLPIHYHYKDTLTISCVGYVTKEIVMDTAEVGRLLHFVLIQTSQNLNEITINTTNVKPRKWILGAKQKPIPNGGCLLGPGFETGLYFFPDNNKSNGYLKDIYFYITSQGVPNNKFRTHVYSCSKDTLLPDIELTDSNMIVAGPNKGNDWIGVDVSNLHIPVNGGIFITMEWINGYGNDNSIQKYRTRKSSLFYRVPRRVRKVAEEEPLFFKGQVLGCSKNTYGQITCTANKFNSNGRFSVERGPIVPMIFATYIYYR